MIHIKTQGEIEQMKAAGALAKSALRLAGTMIEPGMSTKDIDTAVENFLTFHGAKPTFKHYHGFPASICSSINEQVVHGIPSPDVIIRDGDIVSIDTGATFGGWVGDNAWTFYAGTVSGARKGLCECALDCLKAGIAEALPGNRLGDIGSAIQELAEKNGYGVIRDYEGHGVGHVMHEDPGVPNWGKRGRGVKLQVGMVIAIEPMISLRDYETRVWANGWTVQTADGSAAAHYENTIAITEDGPVVLTADTFGAWCSMQGGKPSEES